MPKHNLFWLFTLAVLWGPTFLFNKIATREISILTLTAIRVGMAALALYLVLKIRRGKLPCSWNLWKHLFIISLLASAVPYLLFAWGSMHVDISLGGVLFGCAPIFTAILAHLTTDNDRLTPRKMLGVGVGAIGLIFLFLPALMGGVNGDSLGILAVLAAAMSTSMAFVYARKHLTKVSPLTATTGQLLAASTYMIPLALIFDSPATLANPSPPVLASILLIALACTAMVFVIYYYLLRRSSASYVSMVTYLLPLIGITLGVIFFDERLHWNFFLGSVMILLGVFVVSDTYKKTRLLLNAGLYKSLKSIRRASQKINPS